MELAPLVRQRATTAAGAAIAGAKIYTYEAGTSTPKATYQDRSGTPNTNPIIADADGWYDLWLDSGYYKIILKDASDNLIWTKDQVSLPDEAALASAFWRDVVYVTSADSPLTLTQSHNGKLMSVDASSGAVVINLPQISLTTLPYNVGFKITNATNTLTINRAGTDTIEGATSKIMASTNASCQLIADIDKSPDQWALLDFGIVDFSAFTTVTADSTDFVPIVDTSAGSINRKTSFKTFKNATYRSVTTTDSVGADDETMKLSGASFTSTLPAIGVAGKRYKFIHQGTSLSQVYTLATTGGNTVGGVASGSYALYTNGEVLEVEDPGFVFAVTSANATIGAVYSNNGQTFTVTATISGGSSLSCSGTGAPASSGTLTKVSGTGDATISFSSFTGTDWLIVRHVTNTGELDLGAMSISATSAYVFTVTSANATIGAVYSNNGFQYTVSATIAAAVTLNCAGTGTPAASGTLTKVSGTGDATITFSSRTITGVPVKGTTSQDKIIGYRNGRFLTYNWRYTQTGAGSSAAGSGDYVYYHPTNITQDITYVNPVLTVGTVNAAATFPAAIGYGMWNDGATLLLTPLAYSATQFRMIQTALFSSVSIKGSGNGPISTATQGGAVTITIAVSGWQP